MSLEPEQLVSFRRAKIPMRYHAQTLSLTQQGPLGERLAAWVNSTQDREDTLAMGRGMTILNNDDVFFLLARGLLLKGKAVRVASLDYFFRGADGDPPIICAEVECLFLTGFYDPAYPQAFTDAERYRIQWLLRDRLDAGLPTFFLVPQAITSCTSWWSADFLKLISQLSPEQA